MVHAVDDNVAELVLMGITPAYPSVKYLSLIHICIKVRLLRLFGAQVGVGVNIKPNVNIKYPWLLEIGD